MKLLFILLGAQTSAVIFAEHHRDIWSPESILSLGALVSFSGYFIFNILNYKK